MRISINPERQGKGGGLLGVEESMAKAQKAAEGKICHSAGGIGIHIFVPMILVALALIIMHWETVKGALLSAIPICCFPGQVGLQRPDSVFWLFLCNAIIVVLSIESGFFCAKSSADQSGDSSSFVTETETWPKQQNVLEGTGMGSREDPGKIECIESISMTVTLTQSRQKATKRSRSGTSDIRGTAKGRDRDEFYMSESMAQAQAQALALAQAQTQAQAQAQAQALVEYEPKVTMDGSEDEMRKKFDDFIAKVHRQIRFPSSPYL